MGLIELNPLLSQVVNVRRKRRRITIATQRTVEVVGNNQENIASLCRGIFLNGLATKKSDKDSRTNDS